MLTKLYSLTRVPSLVPTASSHPPQKATQMLKLDYLILFPVLPYLLRSQDLFSESPQLLTRKRCFTPMDCVGDPLASCNEETQQCVCSPTSNNISTLLVVNQTLIQCIIGKKVDSGCRFHQECTLSDPKSVCRNQTCQCATGLIWDMGNCQVNGTATMGDMSNPNVLPVMIVLGFMFIGMCVALNMFSRARFGNTQGVFNNPNAASILKDVQVAHAAQRNKSQRRYSSRPSITGEPVLEQLDSSPGPHRPPRQLEVPEQA